MAPGPIRDLWITVLLAASAAPLAAQQLPAQPNAVRNQLSQPAVPRAAAAPAAQAGPATSGQTPPPAARTPGVRRDPFDPLVGKNNDAGPAQANLPPGKAGLLVNTLRLDGLVRSPNGMIAVVSNPQMRVYFLREGDQLYDGQVGTITLEAVSFHQTGKDPFGAPIEREVIKRLYPLPGEQP